MSTQTLLLDNYDSFTFDLFQLLAETNGAEAIVVRNDAATAISAGSTTRGGCSSRAG